MAFTYSGDPAGSNRNAVRFLIGDTDTANAQNQLLADAEIDWVLTKRTDIYMAAADCCEAIAAKLAKLIPIKTVHGISRSLGDRVSYYLKLAEQLSTSRSYAAIIKVGGVEKSINDELDKDTSVTQPVFKTG